MSERTALYRIYDAKDALLYIGITNNFGRRWAQHGARKPWWRQVRRQTVLWYDSRAEAEAAEVAAIRNEHPLHNTHNAVRTPARRPRRAALPSRIERTGHPGLIEWDIAHYEAHGCSRLGCGCGCRWPSIDEWLSNSR